MCIKVPGTRRCHGQIEFAADLTVYQSRSIYYHYAVHTVTNRPYVGLLVLLLTFRACTLFGEGSRLLARGDSYYPPFEYLDETGEPAGFNVDIFRAVCEVMHLDAEIRLGPWTEVRGELERGEIDLLLGMFQSPTRDHKVDFSVPHASISHTVFVPDDSPVRTLKELHGKKILVQQGDIVHDYLLANKITDHIIPVVDQKQALLLLNKGYYDAAFLAKVQGLYFQEELRLGNIKTIEDNFFPRRYCFAVKEGDQELVAILNEGLNILKLNGAYEEIHDRWFGILERQSYFREIRRAVLLSFVAGFVLLLSLLGWTWSLRHNVQMRTRHLKLEIARRKEVESNLLNHKQRLEASLREKETLLAEVHHRVKNNLQIINSLLELQRSSLENKELDRILKNSQSRIRSMAIVHEQLYGADTFSTISLEGYVRDLVGQIIPAYQSSGSEIAVRQEVEELEIQMDQAIPLGLLISEIITNSFQHAFPDTVSGLIFIGIRKNEQGELELTVSDNGVGGVALQSPAATLGTQLIQSLVQQLKGKLFLETGAGTRYRILFNLSGRRTEIVEQGD